MALLCQMLCICALFVPSFVEGGRPFHIPRTLFSPALENAHLPQFAREIRAAENEIFQQDEDANSEEDASTHYRRKRRDASSDPILPKTSYINLNVSSRTLYMYWTPSSVLKNNILLLVKSPKGNSVYQSTNFGQNWKNINDKLKINSTTYALIDHIYISQADPHFCILTDVTNNVLFITTNMQAFKLKQVSWVPSQIHPHPRESNYVLGHDKHAKTLFFSNNKGRSWTNVGKSNVRFFEWGIEGVDKDQSTFYVESLLSDGAATSEVTKFSQSLARSTPLLTNILEFDIRNNFLFATVQVEPGQIKLKVSHNGKNFVDTQFPNYETGVRDFFVYEVEDDKVFVVINHKKNASHMYLSDYGGVKYYLSIERVLYHNPWTDVSSPWLRSVVPYAFVDVHKIKSVKGTYIATQLTRGRVGRRHLLNLITYNKGGTWQRIRAPTRDVNGNRIYCFLPSCSLHFNLKYGSVYHVSPSEETMSKASVPGLVMALGVASTNLKIYPDFYLSTDGGLNWKRVKRGKFQFAVGNHGSVIVAVPYRRQSNQLHYSVDGGDSWKTVSFHHRTIYTMDVATQSGEKLLKFLIYGHVPGSTKWVVFYVDMEPILRKTCNPASDYIQWTPSDTRIGDSRCTLGRQITYQIRNWTIPCKVPSQFTRSTTISNCPCTRSDFMCDFGFSRKTFEQDCSLLSEEDMNKDGIVPANCPEGTFYNRTRGYRKIPFDTCEGGYESDFLPVSTPCPVQNLEGLTVTNSKLKNSAVHVGDSVNFTAALKKGYIANIMFRWDFGYDNKVTNGTGKKYATMKHTYSRAGHFVLMVTAHNTKSTLIKRLDVFVQVGLENRKINVSYYPPNPAINKPVVFIASVNDNSVNDKGQLTYKWDFGQGSFQAGAATLKKTFTQARTYIVKVQISNRISTATKQISVTVAEVLEGLLVQAKVFVAVNTTVPFTATLAKGSVENVNFTWDFGDGQGAKHAGKGLSAVQNTYSSAGLYTVTVTAKNSITTLVYLLNVVVQMRLESRKLRIFYDPPDPSSKQPVSFTATILDDNPNAMGSLTYKWNFGDGSRPYTTTTPIHSFSRARRYNVTVEVANKVSKATTSFIITVTEDLTPRNPKVSSRTARTVTLIWDHPVAHDRFIDGYRIFKSTQENSGFSQAATVSSSRVLSQNIPNLMPYTKYYFKVASYSEGTIGTFSKVITATTLEDVPSKPMNFRAYPKTSTSIQLQWERPKYPNGKLTNYWVEYWSGTERRNVKRYQPTIMQATVSNLKEDSTYNFEITAETAEGKGSKAGPLVVKTNVSAPTMPPRNVRKIGGNTTCILLQWDAPYMARDDKRLFPVEKYIVYANSKEILTTSQTFADVCSLKPDRQYVFAVKAKSVKGTGPPSEKKNFRTAKPNPTAPAEFNVNVLSSRSVEFSWKEPKVTYGGVENYIIEQVEPTPNKGPYEVPGNKYEFKLTELTPYTTYKFEIGAKSKKSGRVSWSEVTEVQTPEDVPDTLTKTDIETRVEVPTSSTIKLIWRVPRPNGILTGYKIRWGHVSDQHHVGSHEINIEDPNVNEHVFKHLHANTEYSFSVRPRTKIGESDAFSEPVLQFTGPAMNMTERVSVVFEHLDIGTISRRSQDDQPLEQFVSTFIKAAAKAANLATEERIAGVDVKGKRVEFDLLPPLKEGDVSTKDAKASLNKGFQVGKAKAIKGSLVVVHVYIEKNGIQGTVVPVKAAAQSGYSSVSKNTLALAIVIPIVIIGIALLVGLVFYYRKYKNLETRYGRVTGGLSGNQMDPVVYNGGMSNDTTDEIYIDGSKKRRYKDDEKMPLGEHDELAMI